jgi:hypothetical protein
MVQASDRPFYHVIVCAVAFIDAHFAYIIFLAYIDHDGALPSSLRAKVVLRPNETHHPGQPSRKWREVEGYNMTSPNQ